MIERKFVQQNIREYQIGEFIAASLGGIGYSGIKLQRTPLGEKIVVYTSRPGLIVGRKGQNIKQLTIDLKTRFNLENPQIEISEIENINLDANIVSSIIASNLEKFGTARFKGIAHKAMESVMKAGAVGIEILISGTVPSQRAKTWRFWQGYLKKCGEAAMQGVKKSYAVAKLKRGIIGIQVRIMPPDIRLPDDIRIIDEMQTIEEVKEKTEEGIINAAKEIAKKSEKKEKKSESKKESKPKKEPKAKKSESKEAMPEKDMKKESKEEQNE